jgi:hypothetical protein
VQLDVPAGEVDQLRFRLDAAGTALLRDRKHIHATVVATVRRRDAKPVHGQPCSPPESALAAA